MAPEGRLCLAPYNPFVDSNSRYLCGISRIQVILYLTSLKMITDSADDYHSKTGVICQGQILMEQLPCARKEVQLTGRKFNSKPLMGRQATKYEVFRQLPSVALVSRISANGHMETGEVAFAPNTTRASQIPANEDFLLTMKDVINPF